MTLFAVILGLATLALVPLKPIASRAPEVGILEISRAIKFPISEAESVAVTLKLVTVLML